MMKAPPLRFLSKEGLEKVYDAALRILDEVGMQVDYPRAQEVLAGEGARVDKATNRVTFPPDLVKKKLALLPKRYTYQGRTPEFDYTASLDGDVAARPAGGCTGYIDLNTVQHRRGGIGDWREICHLVDGLPNMAAVGNMHCGDVPAQTSDIHSMRAMLESSRKCAVHGAATVAHFRAQIELLLAAAGSKEALAKRSQVHHMIAVTNPLYWPADHGEQLFIACEYGIPLDIPVMSIIGITSPITVAGSLAQNVAEELGVVCLVQSIRPGHPMAFFLDPVVGNMRTAEALCGAPESALSIAATCQIGTELFGVPTEAIGFDTDGFSSPQTMYQKAQNLIFQVLSGGKLIVGAGCIESITTLSPIQIVIDDELVAIAKRWLRGIEVDDETLAFEAIKRVGPRGNYLTDEHTITRLRTGEMADLKLAERDSRRQVWEATGKKTLESRARDKALDLVKNHKVPPLADDVLREFAAIIKRADKLIAGLDG
jgi:trimethylamine---corrinoid protein Co-methyltransferase